MGCRDVAYRGAPALKGDAAVRSAAPHRPTARAAAGLVICACALLAGCSVEVPDPYRFIEDRCEWKIPVTDPDRDFIIAAMLPVRLRGATLDADAEARALAMQLAIADANEREGLAGRKFGFRVCDKAGDWVSLGANKSKHMATWLASNGVHVVLTGGSTDTLAAHAATVNAKMLVMSLTATAADITHLSDNGLVWRVAPSDLYQGVVMRKLLADAGAKNVAVVVVDNAYGESLAKILTDAAGEATINSYAIDEQVTSVQALVSAVAKQQPDHLVLAADIQLAAKLLDAFAAHASLKAVPLLLSDALHKPELYKMVKNPAALHGVLGTLPGDPVGPTFNAFASHFELQFGQDATQRSFTAHAYDAAYAVLLAHAWAIRADKNGPVDGPKLAEGLRQLSNLNGPKRTLEASSWVAASSDLMAGKAIDIVGASGLLDFDPGSGEPTSAVEVWRMENDGSFKTIKWVRARMTGDDWTYTEIKP